MRPKHDGACAIESCGGAETQALPFTLKDAHATAGMRTTTGSPSLAHTIPSVDSPVTARLKAAGGILLGKTNVPAMLADFQTNNPVFGRTNNPWNVERTPGGSSGGQAAIIAAGGSPLGLASDIGGSIRVPATFCGIAGLKPTAGRLPDPNNVGLSLGEKAIVSQAGVLGRSVADVELGYRVLKGDQLPRGEQGVPVEEDDPSSVEIAKLRVAYYTDDGTLAVSGAVRRAVTEAAGVLAGQGAQVVEWQPPAVPHAVDIFFGILSADGGAGARKALAGSRVDPRIGQLIRLAGMPRPILAGLEPALRVAGQRHAADMLRNFGYRDTLHYWEMVVAQDAYQEQFLRALDSDPGGPFDLIVCPACAVPAFPHGGSKDLVTAGGYAVLYNVLGYPAGVVPVTRVQPGEESGRRSGRDAMERAAQLADRGSAGLPVGVQVVARPWHEHVALAAMRSIWEAMRTRPDFPDQPPE